MNIGSKSKAEEINGPLEVGNNIFDKCISGLPCMWPYDLETPSRTALPTREILAKLKSLRLSPEL